MLRANKLKAGVARLLLLGGLCSLGAQVQASAVDDDPWEGFNRRVFSFNQKLDRWAVKPVAEAYRKVMPALLDQSVTAFFDNLSEPRNFANSLLQLKGESAVVAAGRFTFNTTLGIGGLFDVATHFELDRRKEDFGQTLGYWGLSSGPYLMLPFLGPSNIRDALGTAGDMATPGLWGYIDEPEIYGMRALQIIDFRADLIPAEGLVSGDRYLFVRNAYLQRREFLINDGQVTADPFASDNEDVMLDDF